MADPTDMSMAAGAVAALLVPILFFWLQSRLVNRISLSMGLVAGDKKEASVEELKAKEIPAMAITSWVIHDADNWTPDTTAARMQSEKRAIDVLRRLSLADLAFGLIYIILPAGFGFLFVDNFSGIETYSGYIGVAFGLCLCGSVAIRYILFRREFRAYNLAQSRRKQGFLRVLGNIARTILFVVSIFTPGNIAGVTYIPSILRAIFGQFARFLASIAMALSGLLIAIVDLVTAELATSMATIGLFAASSIHMIGFILLARKMRQVPGLKLLVLRVFDIDETSKFTFSGLMNYWGHFGTHYTIVDKSFLRNRNESNYTASVFLVMALMLVVFSCAIALSETFSATFLNLPGWGWAGASIVLITLGSAWAIFGMAKRRIDREFIRSGDQLSKQLETLDVFPRGISMRFRHVHAMCHDNTWFPTVAEFARRADVLLMDLRGYSDERKGCQREVDFLFDAISLDRILFLTDVADDLPVIEAMLAERYRELRETSPNFGLMTPQLNIYLAQDNDRRDMQGILDWLISAAAAHAARDNPTVTQTEVSLSETLQPTLTVMSDLMPVE